MSKSKLNKQRAVYLMLFPGKCWHDRNGLVKFGIGSCSQCGHAGTDIPNLTSPDGFFLMWNQARKMKWWMKFLYWEWEDRARRAGVGIHKFAMPAYDIVNYEEFCGKLYNFGVEEGLIIK